MRVQVPSTRLRCDSLPAHSEQARFLQAEAGNRAQSDIRYGVTLAQSSPDRSFCPADFALKGSSYGETEPRKATYPEAGHNIKPPTLLEITPAASLENSGKSPGSLAVELVPPKRTNNLTEGTKKNELKVKGRSLP